MIDHTTLKPGRMGNLPARKPCNDCPLARASTPGRLGGYTVRQYLEILHGPADIACHLSKGFNTEDLEAQRSCTGVAAFRANRGLKPWGHALQAVEHVGKNTEEVFATPLEFIAHHWPHKP